LNGLAAQQEYFFVFSGDGGTLAHSELYALLQTYGNDFSEVLRGNRFAVVRAEKIERIEKIFARGTYVLAGFRHLWSTKLNDLQTAQSIDLADISRDVETFRIDCHDLANTGSSVIVEGKLAAIIKKNYPKLKVSLKNSDAIFVAVIRDGMISFGYSLTEKSSQNWEKRRPKIRPFFYAAALFPKFARCLVNLSRAKDGETFLDPFCGSGTMVMEATLMGLDAMGIDISDKLCRGSVQNLKVLGLPTYTLVQGDARNLPLSRVGGIATDIPYGKISAVAGHSSRELVEDFFDVAREVLEPGKRIVLVHPEPLKFSAEGFSIIAQHRIRVHRSLTRAVAEYSRNS